VSQPDLFADRQRPLLDDARGHLLLTPAWIDAGLAGRWFQQLRQGIDWHSERRLMYQRDVDVPRLMASFGLDGPLPAALEEVVARLQAEFATPFNNVGLNLYRDRHDSVAPHNDRLEELEPGFPILLLSLGATRLMVIRAKQPPRRSLQIDLVAGSLLSMSHATQLHYDHGIPKQGAAVGPRISLAFRARRRPA
jgi:alkylated DNA repair dioxygenase AlkB